MKLNFITVISCLLFVFTACKERAVEKNKVEPNLEQEKLVKINQFFLKQETAAIKAYIKRRNWNMKRTDSGLWYEILQTGKGNKFEIGNELRIKYKLELLDGSFCYSSDSTGIKNIIFGKDQIESGLTEAIEMLSYGAKARFIMPTHLAYGVSGDGKCVPPRSAIVYHIEILSN